MEGININLKRIDTSLAGRDKLSKDMEDFPEILNTIMGFEEVEGSISLELQEDLGLESDVEEIWAYLVDQSMLNVNTPTDSRDIELINSKDTNVIDVSGESGIKDNLDIISTKFTEISKEALKDVESTPLEGSIKTDITDKKAIENTKSFVQEMEAKNFKNENLENGGLENKGSSNLKDSNLNSKPLTQNNNLHKDAEKILNLETFKEQSPKDGITLGSKSEIIAKNPQEKFSNKEDVGIKSFSLEDMQNSFRKIEIKDVYSKEISTPKLSEENMDILKDSIVKLIEIKDETKSMNVKLIPRELGSIDISLKMEEGKLVAKILFENEQARQLFSNNIKDLNQSLERQDISIKEIQIDLSSSNDRGSNHQGNREQQTPFKRNNLRFEEMGSLKEAPIRTRQISESGVSILV